MGLLGPVAKLAAAKMTIVFSFSLAAIRNY
jgi:hypothetical protein